MNTQLPPITVNGNWIESVKDSMPDHAKDIKLNLDYIMHNHGLEEVDAHACAFAAALSASNGGLAFEIEMNSPLFLKEAEREASKAAAALMGMNNVWYPFVDMIDDLELKGMSHGLHMSVYHNYSGVSKQKFEMYALAASIVGKSEHCVKSHYDILKTSGMKVQQLQAIAKIAAIVNAIGKVAI